MQHRQGTVIAAPCARRTSVQALGVVDSKGRAMTIPMACCTTTATCCVTTAGTADQPWQRRGGLRRMRVTCLVPQMSVSIGDSGTFPDPPEQLPAKAGPAAGVALASEPSQQSPHNQESLTRFSQLNGIFLVTTRPSPFLTNGSRGLRNVWTRLHWVDDPQRSTAR